MSEDAAFSPPQKKPSIFWWLGGAILILLVLFFLQLFGPSPRIIVSPQTTYITEPLGQNGLPNYEKSYLALCREGVTPENNAAALIWPALWPGELDPSQYEAVAAELGLNSIPSKSEALEPIHNRIRAMLQADDAAEKPMPVSGDPPNEVNAAPDPNATSDALDPEVTLEERADKLFARVSEQSWTTKDFPDLGKWIEQNQKRLEMFVAASARERCYFPSPSLLNDKDESLTEMQLPGVQTARESGRSLIPRAMLHLGEGRTMEAWRDLYAAHRLGRLIAQGHTLVEQLVGIAVANNATGPTATLLHEGKLSPSDARQILQDLANLPHFAGMAGSIDQNERMMFADAIVRTAQGKFADRDFFPNAEGAEYLRYISVDWNAALWKGNAYYDRFAAAARLSDIQARNSAIGQLENEIGNLNGNVGPDTFIASVLSRSKRSDVVGNIMLALFLPALNAAMAAEDRQNASLDLLRISAALAVFRAEHGNYPAKLDELVPAILPIAPTDLFGAKPYFYKRIDDGCLLYSGGPNGQDDHGSNEQTRTFEGRSLEGLDEAAAAQLSIPNGADDISIRVPSTPLKTSPPSSTPHSDSQ
jgi:hypothetical protein